MRNPMNGLPRAHPVRRRHHQRYYPAICAKGLFENLRHLVAADVRRVGATADDCCMARGNRLVGTRSTASDSSAKKLGTEWNPSPPFLGRLKFLRKTTLSMTKVSLLASVAAIIKTHSDRRAQPLALVCIRIRTPSARNRPHPSAKISFSNRLTTFFAPAGRKGPQPHPLPRFHV
jgi:hypothetical protein